MDFGLKNSATPCLSVNNVPFALDNLQVSINGTLFLEKDDFLRCHSGILKNGVVFFLNYANTENKMSVCSSESTGSLKTTHIKLTSADVCPHLFLLTFTSCPLNPPTSPGFFCPPAFLHSSSPASPSGVLRLPRVTDPDKLGILSSSKLQAIRSPKDNI